MVFGKLKNRFKMNKDIHKEEEKMKEETVEQNTSEEVTAEEVPIEETIELDPLEALKAELVETKDKMLRLYSDFDNYKKRTSKERMELIKSAGIEIIMSLLPVLDDFDRGMKSLANTVDVEAVKEGMALIHNKLKAILEQKGLKEMISVGEVFDTDLHDAITNIPAPTEDMKGKVIDDVQQGYYLADKVIRHAKVIVGN
jgi:molecular chaperone GrpE